MPLCQEALGFTRFLSQHLRVLNMNCLFVSVVKMILYALITQHFGKHVSKNLIQFSF